MRELLSYYLEEFNREFLTRPEDRRRVWENLVNAGLAGLIILAAAIVLLAL